MVGKVYVGDTICVTMLPETDVKENEYVANGGGGDVLKVKETSVIVKLFDGAIIEADGLEHEILIKRNFSTIEEAKNYGIANFGKSHFEKVKIGDEDIILCGTDVAYEEQLWGDAYELVSAFCKKFGADGIEEDEYSDFATDTASQIRDLVVAEYEKIHNVKFVNVYDEY